MGKPAVSSLPDSRDQAEADLLRILAVAGQLGLESAVFQRSTNDEDVDADEYPGIQPIQAPSGDEQQSAQK